MDYRIKQGIFVYIAKDVFNPVEAVRMAHNNGLVSDRKFTVKPIKDKG